VRLRPEIVDRFLAGIGELMQRQSRLEALAHGAPAWPGQLAFDAELGDMQRVVSELRRRALDLRTTPVRRVLERLPRVASELARSLEKRVSVELFGEEVEVDRAVLDHLDEPLLHLVRNAVDHGIERPEQRERAGKPAVGTVAIHARRESGRLHLRVEDDGGGLDVEAVRRAAVRRGLLPEAVAEDLPLARAAELLFEPGMSTREHVSEVSGRGVGLDAVKRTLESLGGSVTLESRPGAGTRFDLEVPSMVALQRVLIVEVSKAALALATSRIEAVLDVAEGEVERTGREAFFVYRDEPLPLVDLSERVGFARIEPGYGAIVLVEVRGFRLGLLVERAVRECEVFVRPVPAILAALEPLGGAAILPDGVPVFLLEIAALVENAL
jgi:two-component system chemotaxis sensor kinase CheA